MPRTHSRSLAHSFSLTSSLTPPTPRTLLAFNQHQMKLIIDSIVWAFRHTERNVAETGLNLLQVSCSVSHACCALPHALCGCSCYTPGPGQAWDA